MKLQHIENLYALNVTTERSSAECYIVISRVTCVAAWIHVQLESGDINMTGKMKEKLIQCHNERPEREIISFTRSEMGGYIPDRMSKCILCGNEIKEFRDQLSIREFVISGMCQKCQDSVFNDADNV